MDHRRDTVGLDMAGDYGGVMNAQEIADRLVEKGIGHKRGNMYFLTGHNMTADKPAYKFINDWRTSDP